MNIDKLVESLGVNEKKILPHLNESLNEICRRTQLDKTSVLRALRYLENKKIVKLSFLKKKIIEIGVNGALYKKRGLPERRLLNLLDEKRILKFDEAQKESKLSDDEFKASIGALKKKAMIEIKNEKIILSASKDEISKKMLEENFIESLPVEYDSLTKEQEYAFKSLQSRKNIVQIKEKITTEIEPTELGKKLENYKIKNENLIEQITPEMIKRELWKGKKFRRYDISSPLPKINGGKRHFVAQSSDYARKIWTEMGFKEMTGNIVQTSFWNFDALFTAQDHPVREMQDTFFIDRKLKGNLPDKKIVNAVRNSHEKGVNGSKGWGYSWNEEEAKKLVLRTHTTCLSSQTLSQLKKNELPAKFFAIGKCFRNETVDWSHGFEFNQTEGIVIDKNANFRHLLGYLKEFFSKMGFEKIRFRPSYFPYTEPSVEIDVYHPEKKIWLELGGAGMFRPEVVIPLLGENIPVLAWGPGIDRMMMDYYEIKDFREMYKNDLTQLKNMKFWMK
ncbi:MAG TPA: phenylalanine--tRNA ligase subunit alpha [Patescibacteria group bacterium]|nr:phenylalanine--tRNA ligase subunit alpha [Patescibacteria group bacterium]